MVYPITVKFDTIPCSHIQIVQPLNFANPFISPLATFYKGQAYGKEGKKNAQRKKHYNHLVIEFFTIL